MSFHVPIQENLKIEDSVFSHSTSIQLIDMFFTKTTETDKDFPKTSNQLQISQIN